MAAVVTGVIFLLIGAALGVGGAMLLMEGGSWYYVIAGGGFLLTGILLAMRRRAALWIYAAVTLGTLGWALWEVGFDWWQLAPRGDLIVLLGLWLLMPWVTRGLRRGTEAAPSAWRGAGIPLTLSLLLSVIVAGYAFVTPSNVISGTLPTEAVGSVPDGPADVPPDSWHAYGRTPYGDRYSPLDQITTENVDELEVAWTYHTGDLRRPTDPNETTYEVTPLKIDNTLYLCTPHNFVIALDADTGEEVWRFDPEVPDSINRQHLTCRGLSYP